MTPCFTVFETVVSFAREDADRAGDMNGEVAAYSLLWFLGTGRAFTGLHRACSHMSRATARAYLKRVRRGMESQAAKRGSSAIIPADLDNTVLSRSLGLDPADASTTCNHPFGTYYTLGGTICRQ